MNDDHYAHRILDLCAIFIAGSIAYVIRFDTLLIGLNYSLPLFYFAAFASIILSTFGAYQHSSDGSFGLTAFTTFRSIILAALIAFAFLYLTKTGEMYSRIWFSLTAILSYFFILGYKHLLRKLERRVVLSRKIILLGNGTTARKVLAESQRENSVIEVCGIFSDNENPSVGELETKGQTFGSVVDSVEYIEEKRQTEGADAAITEVWITHPVFSKNNDLQLRALYKDSAIKLVYIPEIPEMLLETHQTIHFVQGVPTINSGLNARQRRNQLLKRVFDHSLAWPLVIVLSPLLAFIAVAIKCSSKGPVIYSQQRYGLDGNAFTIYKFRSMIVTEHDNEYKQTKPNDSRVTKLGRILRRTSMDELPQLFNVINGTMSLVGPRPHPTKMNEEYRRKISHYMQRHNVRPGITGLAQVRGLRGETSSSKSIEDRISSDLEYINSWSLTLDLKILLKTFLHLLVGKNAY